MTEIQEAINLVVEAGHALNDAKELLDRNGIRVYSYHFDNRAKPSLHVGIGIDRLAIETEEMTRTGVHDEDFNRVSFVHDGVVFFELQRR